MRAVTRLVPITAALAVAALILRVAAPLIPGGPWWPAGLGVLALCWMLPAAAQARRDEVIGPLAVVLMAVGLAVIARISPELAMRQEIWIAISLICAMVLKSSLDRFRVLAGYRYIWVLGSVLLFVTLMFFGTEINGARLWIRLTPYVQIEPIEIIKLFIVFFMAAYLADTADVIASARWWSVRANLRHLGPLVLGWGASMLILVLQRDLGMALLLFAIFAVMLYTATRRGDLIFGAAVIFAGAAIWAVGHYPYVAERIAVWLHPEHDPLGTGYQALQARYALAAGGIAGTGYHLGSPSYIPEAATDYVWAVWSEEFGALGALALLGIYAALVVRVLDAARRAPDLYAKLLAVGLATTLGMQVLVIVGGVLGVMPLTGITLPFISYGGSSLFANTVLLTLVIAISGDRRHAGDATWLDEVAKPKTGAPG